MPTPPPGEQPQAPAQAIADCGRTAASDDDLTTALDHRQPGSAQPAGPFAHLPRPRPPAKPAITVRVDPDHPTAALDLEDGPVVFLREDEPLGYLPEPARIQLGW
jgi:hypothetical protein